MNIDFHTHCKLSKETPFSLDAFLEMIRYARKEGLTALALTEHFNGRQFANIYETLDREFAYKHHYYDVDGLKVFAGMEVDVAEVGHILLVGEREHIRIVREKLDPYTGPDQFINLESLLLWTEPYNILKIGAHPLRHSTSLHHIDSRLLSSLDALDLNAKDLYEQGLKMRADLQFFAHSLNLPIVAGSDTHQFMQFGSVHNVFFEDCSTIEDIKACIKKKTYDIEISPCLRVKVQSARLIKKTLKHNLATLENIV